MIVHRKSLLYKVLFMFPIKFSPYYLLPTRMGLNTVDFVQVKWK